MEKRSFSRIVVVPGIMGSELRLRELGPNKIPIKTLVWGEDLNVIWKTLAQTSLKDEAECILNSLAETLQFVRATETNTKCASCRHNFG